jgi:putative ABC transport system substrate-binding protein
LYRWADGQYDKLPAFAIDLAGRQVAVLVAAGGVVGALAAKAATSTIPIVFSGGSDPVAAGLVASLNRPGANVTGILSLASELTAKRLELLRELIPAATAVAVLHNPTYPESTQQLREIQDAAARTGHSIHAVSASTERDLDSVLPKLTNHRTDALVVTNDPFFSSQRQRLVTLVGRYAIPAIYAQRQYSEAGGLMSYGTNFAELFRQVGVYTGLILKGAKPENLPVMQPTKYEVVINLKTAKTLGLTVPPTLLARADEVIE